MIAWMAGARRRARLRPGGRDPLPGQHDRVRPAADRRHRSTRTRRSRSTLTLWDQSGSQVLRGNLLVHPDRQLGALCAAALLAGDQRRSLPELKRVIAAAGGQVGMGEDLNAALDAMFGAPAQAPADRRERRPTPAAPGTTGLRERRGCPSSRPAARRRSAQTCVGDAHASARTRSTTTSARRTRSRSSDWATYGREQSADGGGSALPATGDARRALVPPACAPS